MAWLGKVPIVCVLLAAAMVAVPLLIVSDISPSTLPFESAREDARDFVVRNPQLSVDSLGTLILGDAWLEQAMTAAAASESSGDVTLPTRMLARSQAKLDGLIEKAYVERMNSDPAWRLGVLDARTPAENYFTHAFVHASVAGVLLCLGVLILGGMPLERSWGSSLFAFFCAMAIPLSAHGYRLLDSNSGIPWSGSAGIAGAVLGAYCIRGLGRDFPIPGWILLPMWIGLETFVVRNFWIDDLGSVPWASICAAVGFGALFAGTLRLFGIERALDNFASRSSLSRPHPVISRAARIRTDGDPHQALALMRAAWRDHPGDREIAEAFFSIAAEVGEVEAAADAILPSLRETLRAGDTERALEYWIPIASSEIPVDIEATAWVRLGEALLDAGHPDQAIFSLRGAMGAGISSAHALRVVKVGRDLDEGLARQAAQIALADSSFDPKRRAELEQLFPATSTAVHPPLPADTAPSVVDRTAHSPKQHGRVDAEHQTVEQTSFPLAAADSMSLDAAATANASANETQLIDQNLDPSALDAESLADEIRVFDQTSDESDESSGDVLSHWGQETVVEASGGRPAVSDLDLDLGGMVDDGFESDADLMGDTESYGNPDSGSEIDTDRTPLIDASEELTSPYISAAPADELTVLATSTPEPVATATGITPSAPPTTATDRSPSPAAARQSFVIGTMATPSPPKAPPRVRQLRAVDANPIEHHDEWIDIDVEGRGKSKLPIARIEAIIVAGISGLATSPILLIDCALNWSADASEPLRIIRFRSDRFDPRVFEQGESNPLEALKSWVRRIQMSSSAVCLPSSAILDAKFARYDSLEDYESEVLHAMREI